MLTLLFMNVCHVQRPWDLRFYTGDGLALLSGRRRAYGYEHTERFLAQLAQGAASERLTDSLASWSSQLWGTQDIRYYLDGHKKAVYSDSLLPRGLVGRLDKILGCRALTLLMDGAGHPLLVETARGDQHLTSAAPAILGRYERIVGQPTVATLVIDREGMSAEFLAALRPTCTVITLLRANQYQGLDSFSQVGEFEPLLIDSEGKVIREVAPAKYSLCLPEQRGQTLLLSVALIRDWSKHVPVPSSAHDGWSKWDDDLSWETQREWLDGHFEATPAPVLPTQPRLIPIVSTSDRLSPVELADTYRQRWVAQENIIRDFLLPLGLDTNHGYTKTPTANSEVARRRAKLQKQLENARKWAANAYTKHEWNAKRGDKLWMQADTFSKEQYRQLNVRLASSEYCSLDRHERRALLRPEQARIDAEIDQRFRLANRTIKRADEHWRAYERCCARQRELLRDLEALDAQERSMYELDNTKDHIMSVLKLMLVNMLMWTRDHLFPPTYAHATTTRLLPFFRLPGRILTFDDRVLVTLRPFNDRALNRDLAEFCQRINDTHLRLPAGKTLILRVAESACPTSNIPP